MFYLLAYSYFSLLLSRKIINANLFNISSFTLLCYWVAYPIDKLNVGGIFQAIDGITKKGLFLYSIFGLSFLLGFYLFPKFKIPYLKIYNNYITLNNLYFIAIFSSIFGFITFLYAYDFSLIKYFDSVFYLARSERMAIISSSNKVLPYSIASIPSIGLFCLIIKHPNYKKFISQNFGLILIIFFNIPILFSYIYEGDRTSLIKLITIIFFALNINNKTKNNSRLFLKKFRINRIILYKRLKLFFIILIAIFLLIFIGLARGNGWRNISLFKNNIVYAYQNKKFPTPEFRAVNFTIDYAIARDYLSIKKVDKMFTLERGIFYPLPTYVYKKLFNEKKPMNIGDSIGKEIKDYIYGINHERKIGYGLSPVAEGYINKGKTGIFLIGIIYGFSIRFLQENYNKISMKRLSFTDLCILNSISVTPLIMRSGSLGIYNWILSTTFILFIPISIIFLLNKNFIKIK